MDGATVTLLIGAISCIIGVLTFISARMTRAERDGRFAEKLDTCAKGISEIKNKLDNQDVAQNQQNITLGEHEQRIRVLETRIKSLEEGLRHES